MQSPGTVSHPVRRRVAVGGSVHSVVELLDGHVVVRLVGEFSRSTAPTDRWGVTGHEDGKTVWASVSTAAPDPGGGNDR